MVLESLMMDESPSFTYALAIFTSLAFACAIFYSRPSLYPGFQAVGVNEKDFFWSSKARKAWAQNAKDVLDQGLKQFSGCFQVITESGPKIVIPNRFADEIRNLQHLSFDEAISGEFFGSYPGFETFRGGFHADVMIAAVRGRLTQSLNFITEELSEETSLAVNQIFGRPEEWTEVVYKPKLLDLVARVSSRVFVGPELGENEAWLKLSKEYTIDIFVAARALRSWHPVLRPVVHWFLPECRKMRAELREARRILMPIVEKRRKRNDEARKQGEADFKTANTIGWLDDAAKGQDYDIALTQLGLSFAAIHTTTELVSGIISDLCANPKYFHELREEMTMILGDKDWTKAGLQKLKLLDSVMKESQRHHFGDIAAMTRKAKEPVQLSDGTVIPKGATVMVSIDKMQDPSIFPDPNEYRGQRFLEMRQRPGHENRWQFVSTSPEHLAFGHGKHSCPGRFFASNEIKVILIHLLMKYDWKFTGEGHKDDKSFGQELDVDPAAKALFKRRTTNFF